MSIEKCKKVLGIYIHIPFCMSKCGYCDFTSFAQKEDRINNYVEALIEEIKQKSKEIEDREITTIYFGGGTPSFMDSCKIAQIMNIIKQNYVIDKQAEITIEVNPGTVTREKLEEYLQIGINRISIGLQSTDNQLLESIGRIHTYEEFLETYDLVTKVGFCNRNVDLMLGLPNQTIEVLEESVEKVMALEPEHISIYSLIIEEGTPFFKKYQKNELMLPTEEMERNMYWLVKEKLEKQGYIHYEISNFAKPGYVSKHNSDCWNQEEYLGFGLAAHSYYENTRYSNTSKLKDYIQNIQEGKLEKNKEIQEVQTKQDKQKEYILLGLRKLEGVSIRAFKNRFVQNPLYLFQNQFDKLVKEELIEIDLDTIQLTKKGLDLANLVWEEFV